MTMSNLPNEEVKQKLEEYYEAFHNKEWDKFGKCLSDNFRCFTDNAIVVDKENYVEFLKKDLWIGKEYKISDLLIHMSKGGDMGAAVYRTFFRGTVKDKERTLNAAETSIFIKENNLWKMLHTHISNKE